MVYMWELTFLSFHYSENCIWSTILVRLRWQLRVQVVYSETLSICPPQGPKMFAQIMRWPYY